ncbi:hypothetical protein BCY86_04395 [Pajaroellobacter abortibovis]|uniref:ABC transporter domain-containing protein n=1 Tax=Pajaroellobacter abortibovis TaxID=1882918 RepID=A0A1L6MZ85_9BACT|nr:hypothetical protein BCY86_04395 [Pajaroellobacter abortibovis]
MNGTNQSKKEQLFPLIAVRHLSKDYPIPSPALYLQPIKKKAVDDISFNIYRGETIGVIGESGCGKSTLGRLLMRLIKATDGTIFLNGVDITHLSSRALRPLRKEMQMIFQDPYSSLNPSRSITSTLKEPIQTYHLTKNVEEEQEIILTLLQKVGLPVDMLHRYPHELSGGQLQRVAIARALAVQPSFLVCDEPLSALDTSIQSQIINVLLEQQEQSNIAYLFISHDLAVVAHISHHVVVMYRGKVMEIMPTSFLFEGRALHPYTHLLLKSVPLSHGIHKKQQSVSLRKMSSCAIETFPSAASSGCVFRSRCPHFLRGTCDVTPPPLTQIDPKHHLACFRPTSLQEILS